LKNKFRKILAKISAKGLLISWISLIAALVLTFVGWYSVKTSITENAHVRFNLRINEVTLNIQKRMLTYKQVLLGGAGFVYSSDSVTRSEWNNYIKTLSIQDNYPGILGIGYSTVIPPACLNKHIDIIRKDGFPSYKVWPLNNDSIITSIIYLEPFNQRNQRAFGYNMYSEPVRKAAMKQALEEAKSTLSGKVRLVQETNKDIQPGCLLYLPIYRKGMQLETIEQRRKAIRGFVYSPFRTRDLMDGILGYQYNDISVSLFDGTTSADSMLLYTSANNTSGNYIRHNSLFTIDKKIFIEGHPWYIRYASLPAFEKDIDFERPYGILFSGIIISLLLFITARSMASSWKSEKQLERLLESSGEGIYGLDTKGHCTFINNSALAMFGYTKEECVDKDMHTLTHHSKGDGTPLDINECHIMKALHEGKEIKCEDEVFWRSDGTSFRAEYFANPVLFGSEIRGIVVTFSDISLRKENEEKLEASLTEKDVLLKEIHHRVKNNLQIVASLINLQMQNLTDTNVLELLKESQNRIKSMALIHEKLYMAKNMSRINIANYINDLTRHLLRSYSSSVAGIDLDINVAEINIDIDKTISLGLTINEIVSNSLKHAFPQENMNDGFMPKIHLNMKSAEENIILEISDNGKGIPESFDFRNTQTLGLQLVNALVKQLDGEIQLDSTQGTKFTITFPVN